MLYLEFERLGAALAAFYGIVPRLISYALPRATREPTWVNGAWFRVFLEIESGFGVEKWGLSLILLFVRVDLRFRRPSRGVFLSSFNRVTDELRGNSKTFSMEPDSLRLGIDSSSSNSTSSTATESVFDRGLTRVCYLFFLAGGLLALI